MTAKEGGGRKYARSVVQYLCSAFAPLTPFHPQSHLTHAHRFCALSMRPPCASRRSLGAARSLCSVVSASRSGGGPWTSGPSPRVSSQRGQAEGHTRQAERHSQGMSLRGK